jgi:hypothetical protein
VILSSAFIFSAKGETNFADLTDDGYYDTYTQTFHWYDPFLNVSKQQFLTFLKFNFSMIPLDAQNLTATLSLYSRYVLTPQNVEVSQINNNTWGETKATPTIEYNKAIDIQLISSDETWYYWNVTDAVTNILSQNSTEEVTFLVRCSVDGPDNNHISFNSKEGQIKTLPSLRISWGSHEPTPSQPTGNQMLPTEEIILGLLVAIVALLALAVILNKKEKGKKLTKQSFL